MPIVYQLANSHCCQSHYLFIAGDMAGATDTAPRGADLQALLRTTNALTDVICPEHAADVTDTQADVVSAAAISEHMQRILLQHKALHASGVVQLFAGHHSHC